MRYMEKPNINEVLRKELMRDGESDPNSERKKDRSKKKKKLMLFQFYHESKSYVL